MTITNNFKEKSEEKDLYIGREIRENGLNKPKKIKTVNALLLGDKAVGKTSIGKRLTGELEIDVLLAETYGIDFHFLKVPYKDFLINLQIWDVSFQNYECDNPEFFIKNTDIIFLVFSTDEKDSFEKLKQYSKCLESTKSKLKYLICNKIDLKSPDIDQEKIKSFCSNYDINYFTISTFKGTNFEFFKSDVIKNLRNFMY